MATCVICGDVTPRPKPRGQAPKYCSDDCRLHARRNQREAFVAANPELARARNRAKVTKWRKTKPQSFKAYRGKHYSEHRDAIISQRRQHRADNLEQFRFYGRQRYNQNRDKIRSQRKANYSEREHLRAANQRGAARRRARLLAVFVDDIDPRAVFDRDKGVCGICLSPVDPSSRWEIDHIIPISKGGAHAYANVQLSHRRCNRSKSARLPAGAPDVGRLRDPALQ
jgi:5-methylcytosine-specific restriction endonuclease McrA